MWHFKKILKYSSTFNKMLLSYIIIFLVPFFALSYLIYNYYSTLLTRETLARSASDISYTLNEAGEWNSVIERIVEQLQYDTSIENSYHPSKHKLANELQDKLYLFTVAQDGLDNIWYYCQGDDYAFSAKGSNSIEFLFDVHYTVRTKDIYLFDNNNVKNSTSNSINQSSSNFFISNFNSNNNEKTVLQAYDNFRHIYVNLLIYPITKLTKDIQHYVIFSVPTKTFQHSMMRLLGNNTGMVVLYANNDELLSFYNNSKLNPEDLEKIRNKSFMNSDEYQSIFSTTILLAPAANLGKEWTILKGSTPKGWTLVLLLKDLFSQRFRSQLILIILMFSILMLGMILILKIAVKNYTPVLSLREKVSNIFTYEDDIGDNYSNDYDYIESCIMMIINEKECLKSSLNTHLAKAYDFLIFNLLNGKIDKVENFNKYAASFDIQLQQDYYYIVFVLLSNIKNVKTDSSFIKTSKKNSEVCKGIVEEAFKQSGKFTILTRTLSISDGITIIASFDKKHTELFYGILQDLPLKLNQSVASPYVIGVGDICNAIKGIPRSYINALFACNNIFFKNEKIIHLYNENITTTPGSLNLDAYRKALQKGNTSEILNKLSGIQAIIKSQDMNLSNTFITVYHVLKIFIQESQRFISDFSRIDSPTSFLIIDCCSIPSFLLSIEAMKRFIYNGLMANIYYDEILEPIEQIRLYISHNYDNPNFSIKDVAQHFHMSVPTLSNYYKKETNETLIEFITSLKIEKAIQLLKNSNMSINDIAMAVGYYNTNSFIRRFRQVMHITPGEFRNIEVRDPIS